VVGVQVALRVKVTVPEVRALPISVPREVAVNAPEDELTAVNPFCDADKEYEFDTDSEP